MILVCLQAAAPALLAAIRRLWSQNCRNHWRLAKNSQKIKNMKNETIPLSRPDIFACDIAAASRVLRSGMLIQGKEVLRLENAVAKYIRTDYCSAVSNGTASLHLALIAMGIGPGDEVVVPALSYIATANVVEIVGAKCIFVDTQPRYFNIDESKIEQVVGKKTKAIIPVHEFGLCAEMPEIMKIAKKHNLEVIEDAACALGATYKSKLAGSFGHCGSFSLHPRKAITAGEGGLLVTSDHELDLKIKTLRNHGIEPGAMPMNFVAAGFNYRMTDFQAALVCSQFLRLENIIEYKAKLASIYFAEIKHSAVRLPEIPEGAKHTWQTFHVLIDNEKQRNKLMIYLKENGIMTNYGAQCIPATTFYKNKYGHKSEIEFPNAYEAYTCGLALPLYGRLKEEQVQFIAKTINKFN
jgi:perosamine synthetase